MERTKRYVPTNSFQNLGFQNTSPKVVEPENWNGVSSSCQSRVCDTSPQLSYWEEYRKISILDVFS